MLLRTTLFILVICPDISETLFLKEFSTVVRMLPTKSVQDLQLKSLKKKFKDKKFAAGCSREVIERGAEMLGWDLDTLIEQTILAMRASIHVE